MAESVPVLQEIRDRFDTFGPTIGDASGTSSIAIHSHGREGYSVITYPLGTYGYDGFAINVKARGGIFGRNSPARVRFSRVADGLLRFTVGEVRTDENGYTRASLTIDPTEDRQEHLVPGNKGFELIDRLHTQVSALREPITDALETIGTRRIAPVGLRYEGEKSNGGHFDWDMREATLDRHTEYDITTALGNIIAVRLDGSLVEPIPEDNDSAVNFARGPMVYRSGEAGISDGIEPYAWVPMNDEAVMAFAGLQQTIQGLYK